MTDPDSSQLAKPPWAGGPGGPPGPDDTNEIPDYVPDDDTPDYVPNNVRAVHAYQSGVLHTTRSNALQGDQQQSIITLVDDDGNPVTPPAPVVLSPMPEDEYRH